MIIKVIEIMAKVAIMVRTNNQSLPMKGWGQKHWPQVIPTVVNLSLSMIMIVVEILTKITKVIMMMIINNWLWLMKANILAWDD